MHFSGVVTPRQDHFGHILRDDYLPSPAERSIGTLSSILPPPHLADERGKKKSTYPTKPKYPCSVYEGTWPVNLPSSAATSSKAKHRILWRDPARAHLATRTLRSCQYLEYLAASDLYFDFKMMIVSIPD